MREECLLCGVDCKFLAPKNVWNFIDFNGIHFGESYFFVVDSAIYSRKGQRVFWPKKINPEQIHEEIANSFMAERLVLHLYPQNAAPQILNCYEDFKRSRCEMIVLVYDGCYVETYAKKQEWIQILLQNATNIPNAIIKKIYEDSDPRTEMYV